MIEATHPQRTPPQNLEAEMCVLGSILLDNSSLDVVLPMLSAEAFHGGAHRVIFDAIRDLRDRNQAVDLVTLKDELARRGSLEEVGGPEYLMSIGESVPSSANVEEYARIVQDKYLSRKLITAASDILRVAYGGSEDAEKLLADAESRIFELGQKGVTGEARPISSFLGFELIEALQDPSQRITGVRTGFDDLDNITNGLQPSELIIVAGRPSMGKTTLVNNLLLNTAVVDKRPAAFFSLETSGQQISVNLLCAHARVDSHRMRRGLLGKDDWKRIVQQAGSLIEAPLFIDDSTGLTIRQLRAKARRVRSLHNIELIAVDYLQMIDSTDGENRQQAVSSISRSLKAMARELEIPVVVVSQLSRASEQREGGRPRLSDLRESGSIEQDADVVILIYRKGYHQVEAEEDDRRAELIVAKQRNGPTGSLQLYFRREVLRFENYSSLQVP